MTGTGTAAQQHTVDLAWNGSADAVGYNILPRQRAGWTIYADQLFLDSTTAYTDSTVASGQTYYYVTTAVNGSGDESGYSNQAKAVIPSP